jgi:hypothetical protein
MNILIYFLKSLHISSAAIGLTCLIDSSSFFSSNFSSFTISSFSGILFKFFPVKASIILLPSIS